MEINARELAIGYGATLVVEEMDISVPSNRITTIIGPNGSGKSTVLKGLTRLMRIKRGAVYLDGKDISAFASKKLARLVGVLPQRHTAPPDFKVKDLVGYGRMPYRKWYERNNSDDERIIDWAMRVTGVYELRDKSINACSGGESQRVWIATIIAQQPEILFLDEPTTYLDISHQLETMRLIKRLNRKSGIGVVMVLHDLAHALEFSDWIVVIKDGRVYSEGAPRDVVTRQMMREVYNVDCEIISIPGRERPILLTQEMALDECDLAPYI